MTLTTDVGKILASLHRVQSKGEINFITAVKIAHVSIGYNTTDRPLPMEPPVCGLTPLTS